MNTSKTSRKRKHSLRAFFNVLKWGGLSCIILTVLTLLIIPEKYYAIIPAAIWILALKFVAGDNSEGLDPFAGYGNPEFSKLEIPHDLPLDDAGIQAEYDARWNRYSQMSEDDNISDEECMDYLETRIYPFHPVGQYWNGYQWKKKKDGRLYPKDILHPKMLKPLAQTYSRYSRQWHGKENNNDQNLRNELSEAAGKGFRYGIGIGAAQGLFGNNT